MLYPEWRVCVYPLTITKDRYGGMYSGGLYLAFKLTPYEIPDQVWGTDMNCGHFWDLEEAGLLTITVGKGNTPDLAMFDLYEKLKAKRQ